MRALATVAFHILSFVRGPILFGLWVMKAFFIVGLLAVAACFVAAPQQQRVAVELACFALGGGFVAYLLAHFYDVILTRVNLVRLGLR